MKSYLLITSAAISVLLSACCGSGKCGKVTPSPDMDAGAPLYIAVDNGLTKKTVSQGLTGKPDEKIKISPAAMVPLLSKEQKKYVDMPRKDRVAYFADAQKRQQMAAAGYYPLTVTLHADCLNSAPHGHTYTIAENQGFSPAITVTCKDSKNQQLEIGNLKIAQNYFWTVRCDLPGLLKPVSDIRTFSTEDKAPRLIKIDGVPNVRDLGGRIGLNGKRVRQGMIYRSAGLNDNAATKYKPLEKVLLDPAMKAEKAERDAIISTSQKEIKKKDIIQTVPCMIGKHWTAFRPQTTSVKPADYEKFGKLNSIPETFCGAKAEKVTANDQHCIVFPGKVAYRPAFLIQEFQAPQDGRMQIGLGGDWFYQVWVNGKKELDMMREGNFAFPISVSNVPLEIPVKKGKNVIAVSLLSGSASWTWCCGKPDKLLTHKQILEKRIELENKILKTMTKIPDGRIPGKNRLNDAAKAYVVNDLGWKSDIDLRSDPECFGMTGSPAGKSVEWFHYSSSGYAGMQSDFGKEAFSKVFRVFLDEKNYPIDFHCIAGQDRTGAVAFILNGLLGVSEDELYIDWEVTGFWNKDVNFNHKDRFDHLVKVFNAYPGKTLNGKIENYVLALGFTKDDIAKFRTIMLR